MRTEGGEPGPDVAAFLEELRARHGVRAVLDGLDGLRALRVLVVGEAIVDEYSYCTPLGKAPKEAIVTTQHVRTERQAGGAAACANHAAGFCAAVDLVTCVGDDGAERFLRERLLPNVTPWCLVRPGAPTITKRRYLRESPLTKLFEVVEMDDTPLPETLERALLARLDATVPGYDAVLVADFGHGFLGPRAAALLAARSRFLAANTQANAANLGFNLITKYPGVGYACVDEPELRLALQDRWSALEALVGPARSRLGGGAVSVTRGRRGALVCGADGRSWAVPVFSAEVVDRMGAGDAYFAITGPGVAAGLPMDVVGFLGCLAGALAVQVVGNRSPVEPAALRRRVVDLLG